MKRAYIRTQNGGPAKARAKGGGSYLVDTFCVNVGAGNDQLFDNAGKSAGSSNMQRRPALQHTGCSKRGWDGESEREKVKGTRWLIARLLPVS